MSSVYKGFKEVFYREEYNEQTKNGFRLIARHHPGAGVGIIDLWGKPVGSPEHGNYEHISRQFVDARDPEHRHSIVTRYMIVVEVALELWQMKIEEWRREYIGELASVFLNQIAASDSEG